MEEIILSQKMTELKTTTTMNNAMFIDQTIQDHLEKIPIYLTKENKTFQCIMDQALCMMNISSSSIPTDDDIQHICILIYKMHILSMYHLLWTTYWQSGLGQLIIKTSERQQQINYVVYSMNISFWPKEIKQHIDTCTSSMDLVCYHRQELERQLKQMKMEWNDKVNRFSGYNSKVEQLLQDYIIENLHEFQKDIEHKIELVTYDYQIEAIKQEFNHQNPTEYQVCVCVSVCN
jgi:hypothetical protein